MKWVERARARLRLLFARGAAESRMNREFEFHIDMATEQLMRERNLARDEARRRALAMFGGVEGHKEALRDGLGFPWFRGWSLNVKLAARMSLRYPGVTVVGVLAMAIGIGLGAAYLEAVNDFLHPMLPFDEGDRIVGLQKLGRRAEASRASLGTRLACMAGPAHIRAASRRFSFDQGKHRRRRWFARAGLRR